MNRIFPALIIYAITGFLLTTLEARTCRVVYPERPNDAPKTAFIYDGKDNFPVNLPSMNLSEVIELPEGEITIVMVSKKVDDPKLVPVGAPTVKIPENLVDFYLILTPDPKNNVLPIKINLVDTGHGKLKNGETLWYNYTNHRIAAKLGNAELIVEPSGRNISKDPISESGYYTAIFKFQEEGKGAYSPITEQRWWHDTNSRHLGFIVNTGGKLPRLYFYRDFRIPKSIIEAEKNAEPVKETEVPLIEP